MIDNEEQVELKAFIILANNAANLFNEIVEAAKIYELNINVPSLSGGGYYFNHTGDGKKK